MVISKQELYTVEINPKKNRMYLTLRGTWVAGSMSTVLGRRRLQSASLENVTRPQPGVFQAFSRGGRRLMGA